MKKIDIDTILKYHKMLIEEYGGEFGLKDKNALESCIDSPFQTFDGVDLYPTDLDKCIRTSYLLIENHCFIDGNKRIGFLILITLLDELDYIILASNEKLIELIFELASSNLTYEDYNKNIKELIVKIDMPNLNEEEFIRTIYEYKQIFSDII